MKILHIAYLSNSKTSGVRSIVPQYLEYQAKNNQIMLLDCNEESNFSGNQAYKVTNIREIHGKHIKEIECLIERPDLVVFHSIYYYIYIKIYKKLLENNIPYIIVPHGSLAKNAQAQKAIKKIVANIVFFFRFLKKSIAIQYLCRQEQENTVMKKHPYIIAGNGVKKVDNVKKYNENSVDNKEFIINYIGRYDYVSKGLDILIEACNQIKEYMRENGIKLKMYGNDYRGRIKKLKLLIQKYQLQDIIELNEPVFDNEKIEKMLESDIFIQTSKSEGQSIGLMEAIMLGMPCIVTKGTNFGDIVVENDFGYCCNLEKNDISQKIILAFQNRDKLSDMSSNAVQYARKNFDWENVIEDTINEYRGVLNGKK